MAAALLLFFMLCVIIIGLVAERFFKGSESYVTPKEPKWITYKDEKGRIKTYKTRWAEQ
jgi:hypothetical protein